MKYYIFFQNASIESFIQRYLKKGFQHTEILSEHGTLIAPTSNGLFIEKVDKKIIFENAKKNDIIIVKYKVDKDNIKLRKLIAVNTCVGVIKNILNIDNIFIQTPYQLYKYLIKKGEIINE